MSSFDAFYPVPSNCSIINAIAICPPTLSNCISCYLHTNKHNGLDNLLLRKTWVNGCSLFFIRPSLYFS